MYVKEFPMNTKPLTALAVIFFSLVGLPAKADIALNTVSPNSGITATVTPLASEVSKTVNVYIGIYIPTVDKWFLVSGGTDNWVEYKGGPLPVAQTVTFGQGQTPVAVTVTYANVFDHTYVDLTGTKVYVAYGATEDEALNHAKHMQMVYTIPATAEWKYSNVVLSIYTGHYLYEMTTAGAKKLGNFTPYTNGFYPLANCIMGASPMSDGRVPVKCQDAMTLAVHNLYADPVSKGVYPYDGTFPTDVVFKSVQAWDPAYPNWGTKVYVPGSGWYYTPNDAEWVVHFLSDTTGIDTVVVNGTFEQGGSVFYMNAYSH